MTRSGPPNEAHRHLNSSNKWSDKTDLQSGQPHTHDVDAVSRAEYDALAARVAALESGTGTVPDQPPAGGAATGFYGSGWMTGLGNTQVGGPNGTPDRVVAYRFRAAADRLAAVQFAFPNFNPSYCGGTGGRLRLAVRPDLAGVPDMASAMGTAELTNLSGTLNNPPGGVQYPRVDMPASLVPGALYHLTFQNTDPNPAANFVSVDMIYFGGRVLSPRQAKFPDAEWAVLYRDGGSGGRWVERGVAGQTEQFTPLFAHIYADGTAQGMAYLFSDVGAPRDIGGTVRARQTLWPTQDRDVSGLAVVGRLTAGVGPLTLALVDASGTVGDFGAVPNASLPRAWGIASRTLSQPYRLSAGKGYALEISAPAGTVWQAYAPWSGAYTGGWPQSTYFAEGTAQYTTDSGAHWLDWASPVVRDLCFALT